MHIFSKYSFLFRKGGINFIYNARTNSFYKISDEAFNILSDIKHHGTADCKIDNSFLEALKDKKILTTIDEDSKYLDCMKLSYFSQAFGNEVLGLTIVPTISCNLKCPYCFEETKPAGIMNENIAARLVEFIKMRARSKKYTITWFGGEPLLGLSAIRQVLLLLKKEDDYKMVSHSIITNGTLLDSNAFSLFKDFPLDSMQVTFDGDKKSHDSKRYFNSGEGTFDKIVENISAFLEVFPETHIDLRVNVDNRNREEYLKVHSYFSDRFNGYPVYVYPGILRANKGCEEETFFSSQDHLEFSRLLWENRLYDLYPHQCSKGCCATSTSQYVIGPNGELYLCWEHVGKSDKIIGYIDGRRGKGTDMYSTYKLKGHCFEDRKCLECGLLPLCTGGCPDKRIANYLGGGNHNLCSIYNENNGEGLEDALYEYYLASH